MKLLFATTNAGKLKELRLLVGESLEVVSLKELPPVPEPEEDGETFEQNAIKKAHAYAAATGLPSLADDSGLSVNALGGRPGVLSARYAEGTDADRCRKLLAELGDTTDRSASFVCALALAYADPERAATVERGECHGEITRAPRGGNGFGYDPIFLVPSLGKTMAELSSEEKSRLSHRGEAFRKMLPHLRALSEGRRA